MDNSVNSDGTVNYDGFFTCADCGETGPAWTRAGNCGVSNYSITPDQPEQKICRACGAKREANHLRAMQAGDRYWLYLIHDKSGWYLSDSLGGLRIPVTHHTTGRHFVPGVWYDVKRYNVWFSFDGIPFYGVLYGDNTQSCTIRRLKSK